MRRVEVRFDCTCPVRGDGFVVVNQNCDDAGKFATWDDDCTFAVCENGTVNVAGQALLEYMKTHRNPYRESTSRAAAPMLGDHRGQHVQRAVRRRHVAKRTSGRRIRQSRGQKPPLRQVPRLDAVDTDLAA